MLVGQEHARAVLARALEQDRISHAYLFVGPDSVGKTTAALLFAQTMNCERQGIRSTTETRRHGEEREEGVVSTPGPAAEERRPGGGEDPLLSPQSPPSSSVSPCLRVDSLTACGECESCRRIAAGTHPDVHVIVPGSKGGQNISVEQVRELRQDVARRPIMGRRKLYLMPTAEAMNEEAANTLLKTLEEPPPSVTLILMATSPTRVLPTILSRCQVVRFGLVPAAAIGEWLAAGGVPPQTAAALALTASGRPGLALRWSRAPEMLERRRQTLELLAEVSERRARERAAPGEAVAALRLAERARALVESEVQHGAGDYGGPERRFGPAGGAPPRSGGPGGGTGAQRRRGTPEETRRGKERKGAPAASSGRNGLVEELSGPLSSEPSRPGSEAEAEPGARAVAKSAHLRLLEVVRGYYRDLLLLAQDAPEELVGNSDVLSGLRAATRSYSTPELLAALAAVDRCQQFLERNVAPQLALETLFLGLLEPGGAAVNDQQTAIS